MTVERKVLIGNYVAALTGVLLTIGLLAALAAPAVLIYLQANK